MALDGDAAEAPTLGARLRLRLRPTGRVARARRQRLRWTVVV